ncbi:hypothetical protein Tco_0750091 [Tanacetum coccineum]|uniref:Late embryogenesis abundant protein LEA-2 subgroup domain-containing protein n=1 Tax=Tanacetum coccineum TaxID=301880 RepID=A0ABQ4Z0H9_9ASTR
MSPGNMCHGGINYLTEKYVGPTVSLGIVAGERIPSERSPATIPQRQVTREWYPHRQVARESPKMSMGNVGNVVVKFQVHMKFLNYYQPKKSQRTMLINVEGRQVPLYGAGWGLVMPNINGRVPVNLKFEINSQANLVGRLVKTKHRRQVFCIMEMDSQNSKFVNFKENSCSYS